ncbi:MAG: HPP family protein [Anaerolineae bacterium]
MRIEDSMKTLVVSIDLAGTLRQAAALMVRRHVGTLPVVDAEGRLVGLLTLAEVLHLFMPDSMALFDDVDFLRDFGVLEDPVPSGRSRAALATGVEAVMRPPAPIVAGTGLLRAAAAFEQHNLLDLPVVDADGQLIGIASRVDIGTAFLEAWLAAVPDEEAMGGGDEEA